MRLSHPAEAHVRFARFVYAAAGLFGLVLAAPMARAAFLGDSVSLPGASGSGLLLIGFTVQFAACQVLLLVIAVDPVRLRPAMVPAFLILVTQPLSSIWLYLYGTRIWLSASIAFVILAISFLVSYWLLRPRTATLQHTAGNPEALPDTPGHGRKPASRVREIVEAPDPRRPSGS